MCMCEDRPCCGHEDDINFLMGIDGFDDDSELDDVEWDEEDEWEEEDE